MMNRKSSKL